MDIIFDASPGKLLDNFYYLDSLANYEEITKHMDIRDVKFEQNLDGLIELGKKDENIDKEKLDFYHKKDIKESLSVVNTIIDYVDTWEYSDLDDYLKYIGGLKVKELKEKVIKCILSINEMDEESINKKIDEISNNDEKILNLIKNSSISSELKWNLFCFVNKLEKYKNEYIDFFNRSISIYSKHDETREKIMIKFNDDIERKLNSEGIEFLNKVTRNILNYDSFEKIFVTTSYVDSYLIKCNMKNESLYILLGLKFEDTLKILGGIKEDRIHSNLMIFKNLSDRNRFEILKLLLEDKEYCNGDIAKKLDITGATVSYHMSSLIATKLVKVMRKNKKVIYSFNKDAIRESLNFIVKELEL